MLYQLSKEHKMSAMVAYALEPVSSLLSKEWAKEWKQSKEMAVYAAMLMDAEFKRVKDFMDKEGIWYLPLKGIVNKFLYPRYGMREMSDIDILYDVSDALKVYDHMTKQGFQYKYSKAALGHYVEDIYSKEPACLFEFHTRLFDAEITDKKIAKYYDGIWGLMKKGEDTTCGYHLSAEDAYLYNIAHAYKHYKLYGMGIKCLVDAYMFNISQKLDYDYICEESAKIGIGEFEALIRSLSSKLFDGDDNFEELLSEEEKDALSYMFRSGAYGSMEHRFENRMKELDDKEGGAVSAKTKLRYLRKRLFPSVDYMKFYSPRVKKYPILLPIFYVQRICRAVYRKRKKIKNELVMLKGFHGQSKEG
ncbi:MAG: nucleotidyltransferase family protein [Acetatifactor sp.]|nr:nucleotidyltransferase family protein [Acetatifactor sp.]